MFGFGRKKASSESLSKLRGLANDAYASTGVTKNRSELVFADCTLNLADKVMCASFMRVLGRYLTEGAQNYEPARVSERWKELNSGLKLATMSTTYASEVAGSMFFFCGVCRTQLLAKAWLNQFPDDHRVADMLKIVLFEAILPPLEIASTVEDSLAFVQEFVWIQKAMDRFFGFDRV